MCYHNIEDGSRSKPISQMELGTSASVLNAQLSTLTKWLQVIDDIRLADWLDQKDRIESDSLLITFDDGYLDNYTRAYPILRQFKATGVIFIATQFVESEKRFWWIRLSDAMRHITIDNWLTLQGSDCPSLLKEIVESEDLIRWESRCSARRKIALKMDLMADADKERILAKLEDNAPSVIENSMPLLSWSDVGSLRAVGFGFGAHTHSHPRLSQLSPEQIREEIQSSSRIMSQRLGEPICSFAYPSGDYDVRVIEEMKLSQFRLGFTTSPGIIVEGTDRFELPRLYVSRSREADIYYVLVAIKLAKYFSRRFLTLALRLANG